MDVQVRCINVTAPLSAPSALSPACPEQVARDHAVHDLEHGCHQQGPRCQQQAQRDGQRHYALTHRYVMDHLVRQVGRRLRHALGTARRTKASSLATERDQLVVAAVTTAQPHEGAGQCVEAAGRWLAREAPEVVTSNGLKSGAASQLLCGPPTCGCLSGGRLQHRYGEMRCPEADRGQRRELAGQMSSADQEADVRKRRGRADVRQVRAYVR